VDAYDIFQEKLAKCKADVLKIEYELFLERNKPEDLVDSKKIEKIMFRRKLVYFAFGEAANLAGKTWDYYTIGSSVQEYIRSKGHEPKRSTALFVVATFFSFVSLTALPSGNAVGFLFFATIAVGFWFWWANYKRF
jgi:hypothetical protein